MNIQSGQSYTYNMNNLPSEKERPENLYLSAFCSMHTEQTVGDLDKYDGTSADLDDRPGQVKVEDDHFNAILTRDGEKVIKKFEGTGYISGLTGCAHNEDVKVYMEETADKKIEEVTYSEQEGISSLKNELDKKTGDITFTYKEKEQQEEEKPKNILKPGDSYSYNADNIPDNKPDNIYLSALSMEHADQTVGKLEKHDNKPEDLDPRPGYVKIEDDMYTATMTTEGNKVIKDFEGIGNLMGLTGDCHHEEVKVHMEQEGDKITAQVTYPEQHGTILGNEIDMKTGDITFKYIK